MYLSSFLRSELRTVHSRQVLLRGNCQYSRYMRFIEWERSNKRCSNREGIEEGLSNGGGKGARFVTCTVLFCHALNHALRLRPSDQPIVFFRVACDILQCRRRASWTSSYSTAGVRSGQRFAISRPCNFIEYFLHSPIPANNVAHL